MKLYFYKMLNHDFKIFYSADFYFANVSANVDYGESLLFFFILFYIFANLYINKCLILIKQANSPVITGESRTLL